MKKDLIWLAYGSDSCSSHDDASVLDAVFNMSIRNNRRNGISGAPALSNGKLVPVIEVCSAEQADEARLRGEDVAVFPVRHGIVASAQIVKGDGKPGSDKIIAFAEEHRAGLIVAGGYGHARLCEWVMGGVTDGLLDRSPACLLLSH